MTGTRTVTVAVLVTGALTAVLVAWFSAGWRAAGRERDALEARAQADAEDAAGEAAAAVVNRLEELRAVESQRPYFHYQNLFHDPRGASEGRSVVPSPLAGGPLDPLVALHFQFDGHGAISTPSGNEEVPDNANPVEGDRALLAELAKVEPELVTPGDPMQIAMATPLPPKAIEQQPRPPSKPRARPPIGGQGLTVSTREAKREGLSKAGEALEPASNGADADDAADDQVVTEASPSPADLVASLDPATDKPSKTKPTTDYASKKPVKRAPEPRPQVLELDPDVYAQNTMSNQIFVEAKQRKGSTVQPSSLGNGPGINEPLRNVTPPVPQRAVAPTPPAPSPVLITVAPLGWRATTIHDEPKLVALRQVTTPDGVLTQGLIVDCARVESWLAERGGPIATVVPGPVDGPSAPIGLGGVSWRVAVDATAALTAARAAGDGLQRAFLGRFVPVAALAALCAILVVLVTARAERLARSRARFAAAAAHELRTPLAGIQLYGDMLVDGLGDPRRHKDYARRVAEEASRLGRVVANVLGFSQLERGSLAVRPEPRDLSAAVQAIVERAEPALIRAGAAVELDAPAGIIARFDPDALARIVGNLLDNAEKYSREHADRSIVVTVRSGSSYAEIVVVDHGPGLPAALRRRRFRPFARGTGDDGPPGLGLGLALSQNLATAMGGALTWRDREHGAEFVVTVPMASPESAKAS